MISSSVFADVLDANQAYARTYDDGDLTGIAAKELCVLTCMDTRIDPLGMLGLQRGDAKILRNAGARVTEDVLRSLVLVLTQAALWLTSVSGVSPDPKLVVLVLGLGIFAVLAPESTVGIALLGVVVAWWGLAFRDLEHPAVIGAAACVLGTHLCLTVAGYGPPSLPVSRPLVLLWVRRPDAG